MRSFSSDLSEGHDIRISLPMSSTAPLLHEQYACVKLCLHFKSLSGRRITSLRKCMGLSDRRAVGGPNIAHLYYGICNFLRVTAWCRIEKRISTVIFAHHGHVLITGS